MPARLSEPDAVELVSSEVSAGSEIVLHGYDHRVAGPLRGSRVDILRGHLFAGRDAEFLSIDATEARRRLALGRSALDRLGISVEGFCAPSWLEPAWLPSLLAELGFRFDVGMSVLRDLRGGPDRRLAWAGEIGQDGMHQRLVALGAAAWNAAGRAGRPLKVFFHPGASNLVVRERVLTIVQRELGRRPAGTYRQLVGHA